MDKQEQVGGGERPELTLTEAIARCGWLDVRSAFRLVYNVHDNTHITFYRGSYGVPAPYIWVYGFPGLDGGQWLKFEAPDDPTLGRSYLYGPTINLANLPVKDCLEALPRNVLSALAAGLGQLLGRPIAEPQAPSTTSHQTENRGSTTGLERGGD